jgi:hypothetical protein
MIIAQLLLYICRTVSCVQIVEITTQMTNMHQRNTSIRWLEASATAVVVKEDEEEDTSSSAAASSNVSCVHVADMY